MNGDQTKHRGVCLVCEHPQGSAHFGSTSCLACAAFFRRTVSLDINYKCKKQLDCRVFHELRMVCRACRFTKCIEAGLQTAMVQKRRVRRSDVVKEEDFGETKEEQSPQFNNSAEESPMASSSGSIPQSPASFTSKGDTPKGKFDKIKLEGHVLLNQLVAELKRAMNRRYLMFSDHPINVITETDLPERLPFSSKDRKPHSMKRQLESQKLDHLLAFDYCQATPGWELLDGGEKVSLFRMTTMTFCVLDIAWITYRAVEPWERFVMYTDGSLSSVDDLDFGWDDEPGLPTNEKSKIFLEFINRLHSGLVLPMCELEIDEVEYAALKAFCVWKMGYMEYSQDIRQLAKKHETALFGGLESHYSSRCLDREEKAERMGNLLLLMGTVFELYQNVLVMYQGIKLFDLLKIDSVSNQLLSA